MCAVSALTKTVLNPYFCPSQISVSGLSPIIAILSLYALGTTITGYFTYSGNIESELNKTQNELAIYKSVSEECTRILWMKEKNLSVCETSLGSASISLAKCNRLADNLINQSVLLNLSLSSCLSESSLLRNKFGNLNISYNTLVRNSVKAICCSFGDVQSSLIRNWNVTNDRIICTGSFSVNCSSGETTF